MNVHKIDIIFEKQIQFGREIDQKRADIVVLGKLCPGINTVVR